MLQLHCIVPTEKEEQNTKKIRKSALYLTLSLPSLKTSTSHKNKRMNELHVKRLLKPTSANTFGQRTEHKPKTPVIPLSSDSDSEIAFCLPLGSFILFLVLLLFNSKFRMGDSEREIKHRNSTTFVSKRICLL